MPRSAPDGSEIRRAVHAGFLTCWNGVHEALQQPVVVGSLGDALDGFWLNAAEETG